MKTLLKRALIVSILACILGSGGWYGWRWYEVKQYLEATDDAYVRPMWWTCGPKSRAA